MAVMNDTTWQEPQCPWLFDGLVKSTPPIFLKSNWMGRSESGIDWASEYFFLNFCANSNASLKFFWVPNSSSPYETWAKLFNSHFFLSYLGCFFCNLHTSAFQPRSIPLMVAINRSCTSDGAAWTYLFLFWSLLYSKTLPDPGSIISEIDSISFNWLLPFSLVTYSLFGVPSGSYYLARLFFLEGGRLFKSSTFAAFSPLSSDPSTTKILSAFLTCLA